MLSTQRYLGWLLFGFMALAGCTSGPVTDKGLASLGQEGLRLAEQLNQRLPHSTSLDGAGYVLEDKAANLYSVVQAQSQGTPARPPEGVKALFYQPTTPRALLRAHSAQRAFFKASGEWLPVLRAVSETGTTKFAFVQGEQLYAGYAVADQLNAWAGDTRSGCPDGRAAYYCNGVLVRATDFSSDYHSWENNPRNADMNMVSSSWFRVDQRMRATFTRQGFVMQPVGLPSAYEVQVRCIFVQDASTGDTSRDTCVVREPCLPRYNTPEKWISAFSGQALSCRLHPSETGVQLMTAVRQHPGFIDIGYDYNELVLAYWPSGVGRDLPLSAFFYSSRSLSPDPVEAGQAGARFIQRDFLETEGEYRPVVGFHPGDKRVPFSYDLDDQSYE